MANRPGKGIHKNHASVLWMLAICGAVRPDSLGRTSRAQLSGPLIRSRCQGCFAEMGANPVSWALQPALLQLRGPAGATIDTSLLATDLATAAAQCGA